MKKTTKGAIAAGSAALLLAGGAGTMAAWNASTNLGGGQVASGNMTVTAGAGTWTWGDSGTGAEFNPATEKLVPGDKVTYTSNVSYTLEGKNLQAKLTATLGGVEQEGLGKFLTVAPLGGVSPTITETGNQTISTVITFDAQKVTDAGEEGEDNLSGANSTADLSGATVLLQQTIG